jgi:hypothetical protein
MESAVSKPHSVALKKSLYFPQYTIKPITEAGACWDRGFESHRGHGCLSLVQCSCCLVEVSEMGRSLVHRSPSDCGVSECDQVQTKALYTNCEQVGTRRKDYETKTKQYTIKRIGHFRRSTYIRHSGAGGGKFRCYCIFLTRTMKRQYNGCLYRNTVEPGYNGIGLYDASSITSDILW